MASPLTVRNLSSATIILKSLERFEDPNTKQSKATAFPSALKDATSISPSALQLSQHSQTFYHQYLNIELAPFESYALKAEDSDAIKIDDGMTLATTTFRIIIENRLNERHRIDTNPSYTQKASHKLTPLTPNPSTSYTALYYPIEPTSHLVIHSNHLHDHKNWMADLPDTLPLSALSIPGTHNAHTHYRALPSVRCQTVDVQTQLENGIRFLDIRVQPMHATDLSKKDLYLVHGAFPISLTGPKYFAPLLQTCYAFLEQHPRETILLSLKREGVGSATDEHLAALLEKHYIAPNPSKWYTDPTIPYLGRARGKLVLVRRYTASCPPSSSSSSHSSHSFTPTPPSATGLDATAWPHSSPLAHHGPFLVQDFCDVSTPALIPRKLAYANAHLARAAAATAFVPGVNTDAAHPVPPGPLHLNFLSGSNFWHKGTWPEKIAKVVNRGMEEWVCAGHHLEEPGVGMGEPGRMSAEGGGGAGEGVVTRAKSGDGGTGVVVMDMVGDGGDWDLVRLIVGMNMGVLMKIEEAASRQ